MNRFSVFPNVEIKAGQIISEAFLKIGITTFHDACRFAHGLPYGYNSDREDLMILFKEQMGTCATKHAVIATLAMESNLPIHKTVCVYAMTEAIVTGTAPILEKYGLPYVPMVHCFLENNNFRIDLTDGNRNGKNCSIEEFLYTEKVTPHISGKDEYRLYRKSLTELIRSRKALTHTDIKTILHAREEGLAVLKANIEQ